MLELARAVDKEAYDSESWMRWWKWKYMDNPAGSAIIWLAVHNEQIVGQHILIPIKMKIGGKVIDGAQRVDTKTHPDYQHQGIFETLAKTACKKAEEKGIGIIYAFPNQYSYPGTIGKLNWFEISILQTMIKPLKLDNILKEYVSGNRLLLQSCALAANIIINLLYGGRRPPQLDDLTVAKISSFDTRIDDFWKMVSNDYDISVVRTRDYLNWRYVEAPSGDYTIYLATRKGEICGYTVLCRRKWRDLIWGYILDIIVPLGDKEVMHCLIAKAKEHFEEENADLVFCNMIANKALYKAFTKNGFIALPGILYTKKRNRLCAYINSPEIPQASLKRRERWLVQVGDSDFA